MSTIGDCSCECATPAPVNIPGPNGTGGVNAFTTTTAPISLNISIGTLVNISVVNGQWAAVGEVIFISDGTNIAHFLVASAPVFPYTTLQATYEPQTTDTNGGIGVSIATGAIVTPSAYNGADAYTFITSNLLIPAVGSSATFGVLSNRGFIARQIIQISDGTNSAHFLITSVTGTNTIVGTFLGSVGDSPSGNTITAIAGGAFVALVSPSGGDGFSSYGITTANFALPAAQGTVTPAVRSSAMFVGGEFVIASDGTNIGNFQVTAVPTATSVTLKWLDQTGDSVTGTTILSGAKIVPVGQQAAANAAIISDIAGHTTTGVVTSATLASWSIPGGTLVNIGDVLEFELWINVAAIGGNKTYVLNFGGTAIFTYGPAAPNLNTVLKVSGKIVLKNNGPYAETAVVSSTFVTVTTTGQAAPSENTSAAVAMTVFLTQTNAADSSTVVYFFAKLTPG